MINDPLLHTLSPERPNAMPTTTQVKKTKKSRRSAARSAKILTLGLSTTAMLGMSSGYAFADIVHKNGTTTPNPVPTPPIASPVTAAQSITPTAPAESTPPAAAPAAAAPQLGTVIEVPVPTNGATPGNGNSAWGNQKSSGSN